MTPSGLRSLACAQADACAHKRCYVRTLPLLTLPLQALRAEGEQGTTKTH